jgi:hypothetical protein
MSHSCPKISFTYPSWPSPLLSALISRYCTRFVPGGCGWLVLSEKFKGGLGYSLTRGIGEFEPLPALCCLDSWIVVDRGVSSGSSAMISPVGSTGVVVSLVGAPWVVGLSFSPLGREKIGPQTRSDLKQNIKLHTRPPN